MPSTRRDEEINQTCSSYRFEDFLLERLHDGQTPPKKRERTRQSLMIAGGQALDDISLSQLKISQICQQAGVAQGTFYLYFKDKPDFIGVVLGDFIAFLQHRMRMAAHDAQDNTIRATTAAYYYLFEANTGLMKCLVQHLEDFPQSRVAFQTLNREWADQVTASTKRRWERDGISPLFDEADLMRRAYAVGGLVDQYLTALLLHEDPVLKDLSQDKAAVIETLSDIWKRGLGLCACYQTLST